MTDIQIAEESTVSLIKTNASDLDVARAAWVSNEADPREKESDRIEGLINFLYREKHMSPFEHGSFTFFVETPIFAAREFMRHRTFSFNETSGRYSQLKPKFYIPHDARPLVQEGKIGAYNFTEGSYKQHAAVRGTKRLYQEAWNEYEDLIDHGIAREVARNVLPVALYTSFYATVNPRNLMHFLGLRNDAQALFEIRNVAVKMEAHLAQSMPLTYKSYKSQIEDQQNPIKIVKSNPDFTLTIENNTFGVGNGTTINPTGVHYKGELHHD